MDKITPEEVVKLANLARLGLSDKEMDELAPQMTEILAFAEQLNEVDVQGIELTSQVTGAVNVYREDEKWNCDIKRDQLLKNAPESEDGFIKVKSVL